MKNMIYILLFSLAMSLYANESIEVKTVSEGIFTCQAARDQAYDDLKNECNDLGLSLVSFQVNSCEAGRDDGGYVLYYNVSASGLCN